MPVSIGRVHSSLPKPYAFLLHFLGKLGCPQVFLKRIFESGVAFYVSETCDLIDMVVPLRINRTHVDGDSCDTRPALEFVPMLVSMKYQRTFEMQKLLVRPW